MNALIRLFYSTIYSVFYLCLTLIISTQANAKSVQDLMAEHKLTVDVRLKTPGDIIAKQAVVISVRVLTERWFAKGTRLKTVDIANAVVLPASELAINGSKRINGTTWASQIREFTLYPMSAGEYKLPPIAVFVSINSELDGTVAGEVFTKPLSFNVTLPETLVTLENYVVSDDVKLDIEGQFSPEKVYNIGDALTQTITLRANNVPAMMLPIIKTAKLDGISIYQQPEQITDDNDRGALIGQRQQSRTFIFEQAGEYSLPQQVFYWWHPVKKQLQTATIPAQQWTVSSLPANADQQSHSILVQLELFSRKIKLLDVLIVVMSLLLFLVFRQSLRRIYRHFKAIYVANSAKRNYIKKQALCFIEAIESKEYSLACCYLYKVHDLQSAKTSSLKQLFIGRPIEGEILARLFSLAYQLHRPNADDNLLINKQQAELLLKVIAKRTRADKKSLLS